MVSTAILATARAVDLPRVLALLEQAKLPRAGVAAHFADFVVARMAGTVVGAVGLFTDRILEHARAGGARRAFLLTETAGTFFSRLGFVRIPREDADSAVQASVEFRAACGQTAVCVRRNVSG